MHVLSADTLAGTPVVNRNGENLGNIKAVMLDINHGRIAYAVLDFGGFFGIGSKLFAIPWASFTPNTAREVFVLDVSSELLENAEGFDPNNWPDMSDPIFANRIYHRFGQEPYWE